jgi:esterase/lipase superfamily enzyme
MELLIFGHAGQRVLVFPTRCGRFYDYENFGMLEAARPWIERGWLQLYCVDSLDAESLYCEWCRCEDRIQRHVLYEKYLIEEVLPLSDHHNPGSPLTAHGCSLGAYHAMNIALRHPDRFARIVALSGRYDLTEASGEFRDLFDGYVDQTIYYHTPLMYVPNIQDQGYLEALRRLKITFVVGTRDPFLESNRRLSRVLYEKGIPHSLHLWPGRAHQPRRWTEMIHLYL